MIDRIYCRNFRRIEECDVHLVDGVNVLIGNNGTGKSTIVESIEFCLYGKVRAGTKKESVRRINAPENDLTIAAVDFTLNSGSDSETHYRCCRWYTKKMSIMASLHSYTADEYQSISDVMNPLDVDKSVGKEIASSASGVTSAVSELLGVEYDGFRASFVAKQKELNSLASLTTENRKKFFLELLGYSRLDTIKPEVSKKLRGVQQAIDIIERQNLSSSEIQKEIKEATKNQSELHKRSTKGHAMLGDEKKRRDALNARYDELSSMVQRVSEYEKQNATQAEERARLVSENTQHEATISANRDAAGNYNEKSDIPAQLDAARKALSDAMETKRINDEKEKLSGGLEVRIAEFNDNEKKIADLRGKVATEPDVDGATATLSAAKEQHAANKQAAETAKRTLDEFQQLLEQVDAGELAKCPTCGTDVSTDAGRKHLGGERDAAQAEYAEAVAAANASEKLVAEANAALETMKALARTYTMNKSTLTRLEQSQEMLGETIAGTRKQVEELTTQLKGRGEVPTAQMIHELETNVDALAKALERENEMKTAFYRIREAQQALKMNNERIAVIDGETAERSKYIADNGKQLGEYETVRTQRDEVSRRVDSYTGVLSDIEKQLGGIESTIAALEDKLELAKKQANELVGLKDEVETCLGAQQVVEFLRRSLPSRIAPRLSVEASQLLDTATSGAYTMIEIDDAYEVFVYTDSDRRPLAQMSGGECDVISLCIRIAIAKMILDATGINEQTFILDEIFGALDDSRRESTCEVLQNIGSQLKKILCITHIDEIKDMADRVYVVEMDENNVSRVREQVDAGIKWRASDAAAQLADATEACDAVA